MSAAEAEDSAPKESEEVEEMILFVETLSRCGKL